MPAHLPNLNDRVALVTGGSRGIDAPFRSRWPQPARRLPSTIGNARTKLRTSSREIERVGGRSDRDTR